MPQWCDAHLDLAYLALGGRDLTGPLEGAAGPPQPPAVTLSSLREGGVRWAFATVFTGAGSSGVGGYEAGDADAARRCGVDQLEVYERLEDKGLVRIVRRAGDLAADVPLCVVLLMEGGDPIRDGADAAWWHERGVRIVGLTWATGSRYAGGNARPGPLTDAGRDLVASLDELGIVHDLSHLCDEAAVSLLETASGAVMASHSNVRDLVDGKSQRHLTADLIRAIGSRGGVVGLNLAANFLVPNAAQARPTVAQTIDHVVHVAELMGRRDGVGLGSDMDGGFGADWLPEGIDRPADLDTLARELASRGWSAGDVDGFTHRNWLQLLEAR